MNQHLTGEQMSKCLIGDVTRQEADHVSQCPSCSGEIARLESSFSQFRSAVRNWSQAEGQWRTSVTGSFELSSLRGLYRGQETTAGISSVLIHVTAVALLLFVGTFKPVQTAVNAVIPIFAPDLRNLPKPKPEQSKGGGGSPQQLAVTKGELPRVAPRQFTPPIRTVEDPRLVVNPTILAPDLPNISAQNYGDPLGRLGIPSAGNGIGVGIGPGKGAGVGAGNGGGFGGNVFKIGGGVSAPVPVYKPEPEYSEEARKAKWQGAVLLSMVVDENGVPQDIKVVRSIGLGLDQKAIEAVQKWRFKPGVKDGKAVPVFANIEVNFRLL